MNRGPESPNVLCLLLFQGGLSQLYNSPDLGAKEKTQGIGLAFPTTAPRSEHRQGRSNSF